MFFHSLIIGQSLFSKNLLKPDIILARRNSYYFYRDGQSLFVACIIIHISILVPPLLAKTVGRCFSMLFDEKVTERDIQLVVTVETNSIIVNF